MTARHLGGQRDRHARTGTVPTTSPGATELVVYSQAARTWQWLEGSGWQASWPTELRRQPPGCAQRAAQPRFGCLDVWCHHHQPSTKKRAAPFRQYRGRRPFFVRRSVAGGSSSFSAMGPSGKTCPRWPPQAAQWHSVRPSHSCLYSTAPSFAVLQKLGHPVPELNLADASNTVAPHPAHAYAPGRFSPFRGLVYAGSVRPSRSTASRKGFRVP